MAGPYPAETFTLQETPSFAWRTNVLLTRRCAAFCAMWRSPSEVLRTPRVSFVMRCSRVTLSFLRLRQGRRNLDSKFCHYLIFFRVPPAALRLTFQHGRRFCRSVSGGKNVPQRRLLNLGPARRPSTATASISCGRAQRPCFVVRSTAVTL